MLIQKIYKPFNTKKSNLFAQENKKSPNLRGRFSRDKNFDYLLLVFPFVI